MSGPEPALATSGARGAVVTLAGQVVMVATRVVGLAVLARLLTPEIYGLMAIATGFSTFAVAVTTLGLPMAIAGAAEISRRAQSTLFFLSLAFGVVVGGVIALAAPLIANLWGEPQLEPVLRWLALAPVMGSALGIFQLHLARQLRFVAVAAVGTVATVTSFALAIAVAAGGGGIEALVVQTLSMPAIELILLAIVGRWLPGRPHRLGADERALIRNARHLLGINVLGQTGRYVTAPMLGLVAPPTQVGLFDRAQQLVLLPLGLTIDQMKRVALPVLTRVRDDRERLASYYRRAQQLATYGTGLLFALLAALAEPVVAVVFGSGWEAAVPLLRVLALGGIVRAFGLTVQWLHMGGGSAQAGLRFNAWAIPLVVAITATGLPWGAMGVAVANGVGWLVYWPLAVRDGARAVGIPAAPVMADAVRVSLTVLAPTAVAAWAASSLVEGAWPMLLLGSAAALAVLGVAFVALARVRADVTSLVAMVRG
ncbi:oligosaccharide flippase family protein [Demequina sp. NBRC 110055]|uniref:oligosaccharide flippase family protein n=1 Tax=Demequina sp. NBRC 110055 TaxID=1570344 RepID=UPI000A0309F9|nr:oligosaccharide flippase family protein [Demequina sp. NBRC 110055]